MSNSIKIHSPLHTTIQSNGVTNAMANAMFSTYPFEYTVSNIYELDIKKIKKHLKQKDLQERLSVHILHALYKRAECGFCGVKPINEMVYVPRKIILVNFKSSSSSSMSDSGIYYFCNENCMNLEILKGINITKKSIYFNYHDYEVFNLNLKEFLT